MPRKQLRPSIKLRRRYAALIEKCRALVLTAPSQAGGLAPAPSITIKWPTRLSDAGNWVPDMPEDMPTGVYEVRCDEYAIIRHSCIALLKWMRAKHFIDWDASTLFGLRQGTMKQLACMEAGLDRLVDFEQQGLEIGTKDIDSAV